MKRTAPEALRYYVSSRRWVDFQSSANISVLPEYYDMSVTALPGARTESSLFASHQEPPQIESMRGTRSA